MSRIKLLNTDIFLLERLKFAPLEIGDLPADTITRLTALGLVRKVLGCCEITHQGQLTLHRQHFLKVSRRRVARVTRRNPLFLSEMRFGSSKSEPRLAEHLKTRRAIDARVMQVARLPKWLKRLVSKTTGLLRNIEESPSFSGGKIRSKLNHKHQ